MAGTFGHGLYRSDDGGTQWASIIDASRVDSVMKDTIKIGKYREITIDSTILDIAFSPHDSNTIFIGTLEKGVFRYSAIDMNWLYTSQDTNVLDTLWMHAPQDTNGNETLLLVPNPHVNGVWYQAEIKKKALYKTDNMGQTWTSTSISQKTVLSMAIDPRNPNNMYMGLLGDGFRGDQFYRSTDGGSNFNPLPLPDTVLIPDVDITDLDSLKYDYQGKKVFPKNDTTIVVVDTNKVITDILIDPDSPNRIFVGTDHRGVFFSADSGETWQSVGKLDTIVLQLEFHPGDHNMLLAATNGRGIVSYNLDSLIVVNNDLEFSKQFVPNDFRLYQNYPNPFNAGTIISYDLKQPGWIDLNVYNILGQKVRSLVHHKQFRGYYRILWDGRDDRGSMLSSGMYVYKLSTKKQVLFEKCLMLK